MSISGRPSPKFELKGAISAFFVLARDWILWYSGDVVKTIESYKEFQTELARCADDAYRDFLMKGIPCERPFIGVRIPQIRQVVGLIPSDEYVDFIKVEPVAFEEVLARGMVICKMPYGEMLGHFDSQVKYIDNWCSCDTFCSGLRGSIKKHREDFLENYVEKLLKSDDEYATRVGLVILKNSYLDFDYLNLIFDRVEGLAERDEHYVKMAIAWLLSECFVKFPEVALGYLRVSRLPAWTFNKAISKICDSCRVEREAKDLLRGMRR